MNISFIILLLTVYSVSCQPFNFANSLVNPNEDPIITYWKKATGYSPFLPNVVADINKIQYSSKFVYVTFSSLPSYKIGPWSSNPTQAQDQKSTFKFPRVPFVRPTNKLTVGAGNIGLWLNGVGIFSAGDGMSYNNLGVWRQNAFYFERAGFDACNGHPQRTGLYHIHLTPICHFNVSDSNKHSPLLGFAIDGYPIYGSYGYVNPLDTSSGVKRLIPSYRTRSITKRDTLLNGTVLSVIQQGPDVSTTYPLGSFIEDFEFVNGLGDLDQYNGRFTFTPEYPSGTYAYYVTTNFDNTPLYPYTLGLFYNGQTVLNMGGSTVDEPTTVYFEF